MIEAAYEFAKKFHGDQMYGSKNYVEKHLRDVVELVRSDPYHEIEHVQIAWLHDVLEDTIATPEILLKAGFRNIVIEAVIALTKIPGQTHQQYMDQVVSNSDAALVKYWDSFANYREGKRPKYERNLNFLRPIVYLYWGVGRNEKDLYGMAGHYFEARPRDITQK